MGKLIAAVLFCVACGDGTAPDTSLTKAEIVECKVDAFCEIFIECFPGEDYGACYDWNVGNICSVIDCDATPEDQERVDELLELCLVEIGNAPCYNSPPMPACAELLEL